MPTIQFRTYDSQTLTAFLVAENGATGTPAAGGYATTEGSKGRYSFTTTGLAGEFYLYVNDAQGSLAFTGYVTIANDGGTYKAYEPAKLDVADRVVIEDIATELAATSTEVSNIQIDTTALLAGQAVHLDKLDEILTDVSGVLKSGEEFIISSIYDDPRNITFTRV